jgi:hypothetical protein
MFFWDVDCDGCFEVSFTNRSETEEIEDLFLHCYVIYKTEVIEEDYPSPSKETYQIKGKITSKKEKSPITIED